ncbi:hypothetical protein [Paenibacillus sp. FSL H7-0331]|uniref:hypothetical protein n=1 Tax=Paenibacillus sp. FSL H7-0331 TaxID=1920421 RepID=UPI00096DDF5E|nr:hypothetical protein [Paenibacillus sp. FSL H7-0331]OMF08403.1 hypothetical protein BK127_28780 [Paenibacillus sp. FSL H7-0331]
MKRYILSLFAFVLLTILGASSIFAQGNNFYFKLEMLSGYDVNDTQISEVEFYYAGAKIDKANLSIVSNSVMDTALIWQPDKLIDGTTLGYPSGRGADFAGTYPKYVIIKSKQVFDSVKIYNDSQGSYAAKDVVLYSLTSNSDPLRSDVKWDQFATYTFASGLSNHLFNLTNIAPTVPTNLVATSGNNQAVLSWNLITGTTGYNIYRSNTINGMYAKISAGVNSNFYLDSSILNGVEYYYVVTAINSASESGDSNKAYAFPQTPSDQYTANIIPVMTTNNSSGGIATASDEYSGLPAWKAFDGKKAYWDGTSYRAWGTYSSSGWLAYEFPTPKTIVKYVLDFGTYSNLTYAGDAPKKWTFEGTNDNSNWTILDSRSNITQWVTGDSKIFTFDNSTAYKKYRINIIEHNGSTGKNVNLDIHELEMMEAVPSIPTITNLIAAGGDTQVYLSWSAVTGATGYNIKRSTTAGGPYTTVASNVYGSPYTDATVTTGTTYYYVVTAVNDGGESGNSNEASATPIGPSSRVILTTTMTNGDTFEYNISQTELTAFLNWYDTKATGTGPAKYTFTNQHLKGSFLARKNSLIFDKILKFNYDEYSISGSGTPTEVAEITAGTALSITLTDGKVEEFILSAADYNAFVAWHDAKSGGTGPARYTFENPLKKGPFLARHEVVIFDKISSYDSEDFN